MSAGGRSRKKGHDEEHDSSERWAVSYGDMMTVLCALFIVLYAMSAVDQEKFEQLSQSLAVGFGQPAPVIINGSSGALTGLDSFEIAPDFASVATDDELTDDGETTAAQTGERSRLEAAREYEQLADIQLRLAQRLAEEGLESHVTFKIDARGLVVGLVGSNVFFAADDAALTGVATRVIDAMSGPLREQSRALSIEGHANVLPSSRYATNWELSSARATQVLRRFVEDGGLDPQRIGATGYGDARPQRDDMSNAALEANRRVDIVVQSHVSEEARALLPQIAEAIDTGEITADELHQQIEAARTTEGGTL
ncbi:flagellar motor protein MotB [Demequina aestuarii]|uniref:flagellar motor protein MotB n=1 Tax=Demequina aestuarii TaxID=327095 RepID=UPI0007802B66|nr:flagellar motor protein MotB [Demequina aestuarii]